MVDETEAAVQVLEAARERLLAAGARVSASAAAAQADRDEVAAAAERLLAAEAGAKQSVIALGRSIVESTEIVRSALGAARARLDALGSMVPNADAPDTVAVAAAELQESVDATAASLASAASSVEAVSSELQGAREHCSAAAEESLAALSKMHLLAREGSEALVAAVRTSSETMGASVEAAADTLSSRRSDAASLIAQLVSASMRSPMQDLAAFSRDHTEQQIRARAAEAVRSAVQALLDAADALVAQGGTIGSFIPELRAKFERMSESGVSASAKADHVTAEAERVRREQEENGGGGFNDA